jgi:hypothetical protein
VLITSKKT